MKSRAKQVAASLEPISSHRRDWDGAVVQFFVIKSWRRSRDRVVDGATYFRPVAAVNRHILWEGESCPAEGHARLTAATVALAMFPEDAHT